MTILEFYRSKLLDSKLRGKGSSNIFYSSDYFIQDNWNIFSSVQPLSCVWLLETPWTTGRQASLSIINSWSLLKLMSIESVMPSNHLISVVPLSSFPNPSKHQGLFKWVSSSHQVAKDLEFPLQHQSNEQPGLISFRLDWLDLLAVQGTLKSLLKHHSSKASILWRSAFFIIQLLHWKNHSFD